MTLQLQTGCVETDACVAPPSPYLQVTGHITEHRMRAAIDDVQRQASPARIRHHRHTRLLP